MYEMMISEAKEIIWMNEHQVKSIRKCYILFPVECQIKCQEDQASFIQINTFSMEVVIQISDTTWTNGVFKANNHCLDHW